MAEKRMSLVEAAEHFGIAPNSVRSRWKAGKLRGERDNNQKVWVWVDTEKAANDEGSKREAAPSISKPSKFEGEGFEAFEIKALQDHLKTALEQLGIAQNELKELRPLAAKVERLEAEKAGMQGQLDIRAEQLAELRQLLADMKANRAEEFRQFLAQQPAKGFFARLFGR